MHAYTDAVVLDPFAGTGTVLRTAKKLGRKYVGIDNNPDYVERVSKILNKITTY